MIFGATLEQWAEFFKMAVAAAVAISAVVGPIVYPIYRKWSEKIAADTAFQNVTVEQANRYGAVRGAPPVTQASPPSSTGDSRVQAAIEKLLPPSPTPAEPAAPLIDYLELARQLAPMMALMYPPAALPPAPPAAAETLVAPTG